MGVFAGAGGIVSPMSPPADFLGTARGFRLVLLRRGTLGEAGAAFVGHQFAGDAGSGQAEDQDGVDGVNPRCM
jgi:hypothetical protein